MLPRLVVSNEPARQACGAPDYILLRKEAENRLIVPIGGNDGE